MKTKATLICLLSWLMPAGVAAQIAASNYGVATIVTGFVSQSFGVGPTGVALDAEGNLYVSECFCPGTDASQGIYKFPPAGGVASAATKLATVASLGGVPHGLTFGKDGNLYAALPDAGQIVQVDTATGALLRVVASGIFDASALATDPLSGDLFVDQSGAADNIYRVSLSGTTTPPPVYATIPHADGLAFAPDGTLYAISEVLQAIVKISGTNSPPPNPFTWTAIASVPVPFGIALSASSGTPFLYANRADGKITKVDLTTSPPSLTNIVTQGTRGDYAAVGPDGCLYASQSNTIIKVTNIGGDCVPPPLGPLVPTNPGAPLQTLPVLVDVKPTSCPNPINIGASGTITVAIVGTASFDVTEVDPSTVMLQGVAPLRSAFEDVTTPFTGAFTSANSCTTAGPDGIPDLVLQFSNAAISAALGKVKDGRTLFLNLTGSLKAQFGSTPIAGSDVVVVRK